jgi:clan AA aspartic protease
MGLTDVLMEVANPRAPSKRLRAKFLVDSGATYSVLPEALWRALKLKPEEMVEFALADGSSVERGVTEARFFYAGRARTAPAILGSRGDVPLLGVVTLENLGLMLNPLRRELVPLRTMLAPLVKRSR